VTGLILILGGGETLSGKFARAGGVLLGVHLRAVGGDLHVRSCSRSPPTLEPGMALARIVFMIAGAVTLYAAAAGPVSDRLAHGGLPSRPVYRPLIFGAAHYKYAGFTATMVPAWIPPNQIFWAYCDGRRASSPRDCRCSAASGRASVDAARGDDGLFVVLVHVPRVVALADEPIAVIMSELHCRFRLCLAGPQHATTN